MRDNCQRCGRPLKGEVALVNGEEWCHPCADLTMIRCCQCDGWIVYGEPHVMNANRRPTYWCIDCIEEYSDMCWPEEWGLRKSGTLINRSHNAAHA